MSRTESLIICIVVAICICLLFAVGVQRMNENDTQHAQADYVIAPKVHTCTEEQMTKVQSETLFCKNETGYFASYCYGTAIMRNCTKNSTTEN